ncbi:MAG: hypothetical protein ABIT07_00985 [Ferruginibacter sp.]
MISNDPKKILFVQLFSNGDCLYATAVARQVKKDFPNSNLTWAIATFCKNIIALNPYVDEILEVGEVAKDDIIAFRKYKKKVLAEKKQGIWDEVFVTTNMDDNLALYDGTIRGMILRAYPYPITVPLQPVLVLSEQEKNNVAVFAEKNRLSRFKNVILWEYAPLSGQSVLEFDFVMKLANKISAISSTCVILSSANKFKSSEKVIDASVLTVRENAALTHYCSLLIGCSSGITWLTTSSAAKFLPMVQLLNPNTIFLNAPSVDFNRYKISTENLIEITAINETNIIKCVDTILTKNFSAAKEIYNQALPLQFNTTRKIVYNMLCYLQFKSIAKHYRIMVALYGKHKLFLKAFFGGIVSFPVILIKNLWRNQMSK